MESCPNRGSETATGLGYFTQDQPRQEQHNQQQPQQPPDLLGQRLPKDVHVPVKCPGKSLVGRRLAISPPLFGGPPSDPSSLLLWGWAIPLFRVQRDP